MDGLRHDLRLAVRMLRQTPAFAAAVILIMTVGIGANVAVFSVVRAALLRPPPYKEPGRLVLLQGSHPTSGTGPWTVSLGDFRDWQDRQGAFDRMAAVVYWTFTLTGMDLPERVLGVRATGELFDLLGVPAAIGRTLQPGDVVSGREVAVLSHGLWTRVFGASPTVVGESVTLNGAPTVIVGVMPPAFRFPADDVELWTPLARQLDGGPRDGRFLLSIARLGNQATLGRAQEEMTAIAADLAREHPDTNRDWTVWVVPVREALFGDVRPALTLLFGVVGLVLLVACANVAGLLVARASARGHEFAVRAALGAGRGRLARQCLVESAVLAAAGAAVALLVAWWALRAIVALAPADVPRLDEVRIDGTVLAFAILAALVTALLGGLAPAVEAARSRLRPHLAERRDTARGRPRLRAALVLVQLAAAPLLVTGALVGQSLARVLAVDPGFDPDRLLTLNVFLGPPRYREMPQQKAYLERALAGLESLPGVEGVAASSAPPLATTSTSEAVVIEGRPFDAASTPRADYRSVSPQYFQVLRVPIKIGRAFTAADGATALPVAIVNEAFARRWFPDRSPVGHRLRLADPDRDPDFLTIVGVAGDVRSAGLDREEQPAIYVPQAQRTLAHIRWSTLLVRTAGDPQATTAPVRRRLADVDPAQPAYGIGSMAESLHRSLASRRFSAALTGVFGALALFLASAGLYSLVAYGVTLRRRELAIRMALGARATDVRALILKQGLALAANGLAIGSIAALALGRYVDTLLFGLTSTDPATFLGVAGLLLAVAGLASYVPARRAAALDPSVLLTME